MARHGENIYKRKDGRWEARFVKEITIDGKKKYGSVYASIYTNGGEMASNIYSSPEKDEFADIKNQKNCKIILRL